jgi:hypothetical protein
MAQLEQLDHKASLDQQDRLALQVLKVLLVPQDQMASQVQLARSDQQVPLVLKDQQVQMV